MKDCSKSFVLFPGRGLCLVLYAQLKDYVWSKLLWLLHACFDLIIWDFAIVVSNVTYQCRRSFLSRFVMSPKHPLVRSHFVPTHACFFCFSSHSLKLKSLQTKNFDQLKLCPQCPMCPLLFTMKSFARSYNQFLLHSLCKQVCWSVFGAWKRKRHICTKRKNNLTPKCAFPAHLLPHSSL